MEAIAETTITWVMAPGRQWPGRHSSPGRRGWTQAKGLRLRACWENTVFPGLDRHQAGEIKDA